MLPGRKPGRPRSYEAFIFPGVGIATGVLTFIVLSMLWPVRVPAQEPPHVNITRSGPPGSARPSALGPLPTLSKSPSSAPQDVRVVGASGTLTISWAAPADAQGVSFQATAVPADRGLRTNGCSTRMLSCAIKGLTNGATYTVEVRSKRTGGAMSAPLRVQAIPHPGILTSKDSALWLDANDAATVTAGTTGGAVSQWRDKSGRGNSATQPTASERPVLRTVGQRHALAFNGTQSMIVDGRKLPSGTAPSLVFVVVRMDDPHPEDSCFAHVLAWGTGQARSGRIIHKACNTALAYAETFDTFTAMKAKKPWPIGRMALLTADFRQGGVGVRMNGTPDYTWTAPPGRQANTLPQPVARIGAAEWSGLNERWRGLINEVIILSGNVNPADRDQVERYLIRKWGITG